MATAASRGLYIDINVCRHYGRRLEVGLRGAFLRIDHVRDLKVQRKVGLEILGIASIYYPLQLDIYCFIYTRALTYEALQL